ncbi:MAG: DUF1616 domain-containing protein [Halobacteriaceae archaeon]
MSASPRPIDLVPPWLRRLPADLAATIALVGAVNLAVFLPVLRETPLRILLGLPFVLFVPGYAFIAALFPEAGDPPTEDDSTRDRGIDGIERVALSFGLSIAVVPLIGLVLNFTPWGIRLTPIMVAVSAFTLLATYVAAERRWALPPEDRFQVPYRDWVSAGTTELLDPSSRADAALNVLLVASILLATASVAYAVAVPKQGESFTEFYLLTRNESDALVAADYPTNFSRGEARPVVVGVTNQEHRAVRYSIVVELQRVQFVNNTTVTVLAQRELTRLSTGVLAHNETYMTTHNITPTMTGDRLRLVYLLYRGEAPANASIDSAYRELHLWINVSG